MSLFAKVKHFFGFEKTVIQIPKTKTLIDLFKERLAATPTAGKADFLAVERRRAEEESNALLSRAKGQAGDAVHFFLLAREHFAFEVFLEQLGGQSSTSASSIDKKLEGTLGHLLNYAEVFAKPGQELLNFLEQYIQEFEEAIFLAEARGEYGLSTSEQGRWIKLPFLRKEAKIYHRQDAQLRLGLEFVECPELNLLEMDTHVPWQAISFLEFTEKVKSGRMVLLREPKSEKYYAYIYK